MTEQTWAASTAAKPAAADGAATLRLVQGGASKSAETNTFGRALMNTASEAAFKALANLEAGTDFIAPAGNASAATVTATGGATARTLADRFGSQDGWNVRDFGHANAGGVVEEATFGTTGTISSGDTTFTDPSANFTAADVGKYIVLHRVGTDLPSHAATIASRNSATSIELSSAPAWSLSGNCSYWYGIDNAPAFNAAITAANALGGGVIKALGYFGVADTVYLKSGVFIDLGMMPAFREGVDYLESTHWKGTRGRIISLAAMDATVEADYTGISDAATGDVMGVIRGTVDGNGIATNPFKADRSAVSGIAGSAVYVRQFYARGGTGAGMYLRNQSGFRGFDFAASENMGHGVDYSGTDSKFVHPECQCNGGSGFKVANGGEFNTIIGGKMEDNREYGLETYTHTDTSCLWTCSGVMFQNNYKSNVLHRKDSGTNDAILTLSGCQFGNGDRDTGSAPDVDVYATGANAKIILESPAHVGEDVEYLYRAVGGAVIRSVFPALIGEPTSGRYVTSTGGSVRIIDIEGDERILDTVGGAFEFDATPIHRIASALGLKIDQGSTSGAGYIGYGSSSTATENWHAGSQGDGNFDIYQGNYGSGTRRARFSSTGLVGSGALTGYTNSPRMFYEAKALTASTNTTFVIPIDQVTGYEQQMPLDIHIAQLGYHAGISSACYARILCFTGRDGVNPQVAYSLRDSINTGAAYGFDPAAVTIAATSDTSITITVPGGASVGSGGRQTVAYCSASRAGAPILPGANLTTLTV